MSSLHSNLVIFKCYIYTLCIGPLSFTFQSGSIQMETATALGILANNFTFQSGSIQITTWFNGIKNQLSFTFQSGSIQIVAIIVLVPTVATLHSNLVLFKSTFYIQNIFSNYLYIPIWFYSNECGYFF